MEAPTRAAVVDWLHAQGHIPIQVREVGTPWLSRLARTDGLKPRRIATSALAILTRQLATLLQAGLAVDEALGIMVELAGERELRILQRISASVASGSRVADAMAAEPDVFPRFYVSMVRAGELGASLTAVLARLADFLDRSRASGEQIKSALIYPTIVLATCGLSLAMLFLFVVPRFRPLFDETSANLPIATRAVLAASDALLGYWWGIAIALILAALAVTQQLRDKARRERWHGRALKLPVLGELIVKREVSRFSRTLGTLLHNGVPLLDALAIARDTIGNQVLAKTVDVVIESAAAGKGLAPALARTGVIPPLAVHLIRIGEESARYDEMLLRLADIYDDETQRTIEHLLALLGPALTVSMGLIVATVIAAILTAVLSVYDIAI
jgi:general secretion pathway protein F